MMQACAAYAEMRKIVEENHLPELSPETDRQLFLAIYRRECETLARGWAIAEKAGGVENCMIDTLRQAVLRKAGNDPVRRQRLARGFDEVAKDPERLEAYVQRVLGKSKKRRKSQRGGSVHDAPPSTYDADESIDADSCGSEYQAILDCLTLERLSLQRERQQSRTESQEKQESSIPKQGT